MEKCTGKVEPIAFLPGLKWAAMGKEKLKTILRELNNILFYYYRLPGTRRTA